MVLILWDGGAEPGHCDGLVYSWNGHAESGSCRSLLLYVEAHAERLRRKYLNWIHDLGQSRIGGKSLIERLELEDGLSYWWMTLFVEQNPRKSPRISDAIRVLALEEIMIQARVSALRLVSANQVLDETLRALCRGLDVSYEWRRIPGGPARPCGLERLRLALPQWLRALASLARYFRQRRPLGKTRRLGWFGGGKAVFLCSYFDNIDFRAAREGFFHSYYWAGLPALLGRMGYEANWLQLFVPCREAPDPETAQGFLREINSASSGRSSHAFLDAYLSWGVLPRVLKRWARLNLSSLRLRGLEAAFTPAGSRASLWPLMREYWFSSIRGPEAIANLLWIELFDDALREVPRQKKGMYLCENQAWERAFIHAWRKRGHGQLIAVVHAPVRFWDLRDFVDPRTILSTDALAMPRADFTALNGGAAVKAYAGAGYPAETIVECEALRYGYLCALLGARPAVKNESSASKVLALGDFLPSATAKVLGTLAAASSLLPPETTYTVKPHPNCPVSAADYPSLDLVVVMEPLEEILKGYDVAFSSNMTAAALDAYLAGLPVVVMLDKAELNFSPLRGQAGVFFVSTPEELAEALRAARQSKAGNPDGKQFFFLDPELPKWSRLLAS
ncbi:MAG: hypothetical protein HY921_05925 [Elusimicrobia bacterium]|nr:hypothetical protein [Elusimicrobiota bacterium]